ncbi:MAG: hypothetical protein SFW09_16585 [Hyphomicrobiaceae bacterium]|nr:hypothetical protein [Hyphomicrobiaceae bacterium]
MRRQFKSATSSGASLCAVITLAGCSLDGVSLPTVSASLGSAGVATSTSLVSAEPPVEIYARVARGALKCWFGPMGSLKATHAFHAKADPPAAGGAAEIIVHTRDTSQPNQGALRAYRIGISPSGAGSQLEAENVRFAEAQAAAMTADVAQWASGKDGCSVLGVGGWDALPPASAAEKGPAVAKDRLPAKEKRTSRPAQ